MISRTKTTITLETQRRLVMRPLCESRIAWCERCQVDTLALTPECLVGVLRLSPDELIALVESDRLHAIQAPTGPMLICCDRLPSTESTPQNLLEGERK